MTRPDVQQFEHWLAEGGLRNMPLSDLFNGFTQHLLEGGVPILKDGQCLGAVGVSGVKSTEDAQIARAGIAALGL